MKNIAGDDRKTIVAHVLNAIINIPSTQLKFKGDKVKICLIKENW